MKKTTLFSFTAFSMYLLIALACATAQSGDFDSGSDGSDGDLIFDINAGTNQVFDHLASGHDDGVWNFNTIVVPAGVTVTFATPYANGTPPVVWLAAGDVDISGTLNLNGANGQVDIDSLGQEAKGGPGGFAGGLGRGDGYGPGGGEGVDGWVTAPNGTFANVYGNRFLQPLIGGSGGGGVRSEATAPPHTNGLRNVGGGGGGGAILIASSGTITHDGTILCNGGNGNKVTNTFNNQMAISGSGSGGAIRLIADKIAGTGNLSATPNGRIAVEAFNVAEFDVTADPITYYLNVTPTITFSLAGGTIRIVDIDGNGVAVPELGRTENPDVFFANAGEITVSLACTDIPLGTQLTVVVKSTAAAAPSVSATSTPLAGTVESSTATAQLTVPAGRGIIHTYGSW